MKVTDQGFTERVPSAATPVTGANNGVNNRAGVAAQKTGTGDDLQLSGFAARLNSGIQAEASNRAEHVSKVAHAVANGTFQVDTPVVTQAIVTEGLNSRS